MSLRHTIAGSQRSTGCSHLRQKCRYRFQAQGCQDAPPRVDTASEASAFRAHPDLSQGPADLRSAALTTELCTHDTQRPRRSQIVFDTRELPAIASDDTPPFFGGARGLLTDSTHPLAITAVFSPASAKDIAMPRRSLEYFLSLRARNLAIV